MAEYEFDKNQLIQLIKTDCEMMLAFYLGEKLDLAIPEFHCELWDEFLQVLDESNDPDKLVGILKKLLGVPREHAKTTLVKLAMVLFARYSRFSFLAYCSNTFPSALNAVKDIKDFLTCAQDNELYGQTKVIKSSESDGLYILDVQVPGKLRPKRFTMKAFGYGTQIRGQNIGNDRPDLMVFDDVESKETADSPTQQAKLDAWVYGTAIKAMAKMGVVIFIGNMIAETTLLARLTKDPEWSPTVFGAIIKNQEGQLVPLWPGRWTLEALLADYASYRRIGQGHSWEAEMMNLTSKETLGESLNGAIRIPRPNPETLVAGFITLDPAFGTNAWNDESALTVHGLLEGGTIPVVLETWHGRVKEEQLLDEMLRLSYYWGITTWVIESVAAQRLLIALFRSLLTIRGMSPESFVMVPIIGGKESKASRIIAYRNTVALGSYAIVEEEQDLVDRLESYAPDTKDHDDICDSAAFGPPAWSLVGSLVIGLGRQDVFGLIMGGSGGSSCSALEMGTY